MSAPFTAGLRARPDTVRLGTNAEPTITFRVQMAEVWDTIRMTAPGDTPVAVVKSRALQALMPDATHAADYMVKLSGWEVLDEASSVAEVGGKAGSIFLLTSRRRHPVR